VYESYYNQKMKIYLLARDVDSLEKMWSTIADYTQKIDPVVKIKKSRFKPVTNRETLDAGFTHYVAIHRILPRPVRASYGKNTPNVSRNCHGAAALAAGIYPQMECFKKPKDFTHVRINTHEVPLRQLCTGDWVYLKSGPQGTKYPGTKGAHSFIFLSQDLCLSMNGENKELGFFPTSAILNLYGYPGDILYTTDPSASELKKEFVVLRKDLDWTYPDVQTPNPW